MTIDIDIYIIGITINFWTSHQDFSAILNSTWVKLLLNIWHWEKKIVQKYFLKLVQSRLMGKESLQMKIHKNIQQKYIIF